MMKRKTLSTMLLAGGLLAASLAAQPAAAQQTTPQSGGTLMVAIPADPGLWDPKYTMDTNGIRAEAQIYATLMRNTADAKGVEPWLAESYEASPDLKEVTF